MPERNETTEYQLGTGTLNLEITVGNGQDGSYDVLLNGKRWSNQNQIELGPVNSCKGKTLKVYATVTDMQRHTNQTSVTLQFTDDQNSEKKMYNEEVDQNTGTAYYIIEVHLK